VKTIHIKTMTRHLVGNGQLGMAHNLM